MTITDYHRILFDCLEAYRANHPAAKLTYLLRSKTLAGRDKNKYLFTGNDKYIAIGLYAPHNGNTKTRSINFVCHFDHQARPVACSLELLFDDPKLHDQEATYRQIIDQIGADQFRHFSPKRYRLSYSPVDVTAALNTYLTTHKPIIDRAIKETQRDDSFLVPVAKLKEQLALLKITPTGQAGKAAPVKYYCVGTHLGERGNQLDRFIDEGIWENGYGFGSPKLARVTASVPVGARLAAKTKSVQSGMLYVKAIGTVTANPGDGQHLSVSWQRVDYQIPGLAHAYPNTIREVQRRDDVQFIFEGVNRELPQSVEPTSPVAVLPDFPKNCVLYGPPGTGKTYETISLAVEIIDGYRAADHRANKRRFDQLREAKQIEFVTFHQNYTYEDFVVGIRPDTAAGSLLFESSYGIFYAIAERARANYRQSVAPTNSVLKLTFDAVFDQLVEPLIARQEPVAVRMASGIAFEITEVTERKIDFRKASGGTNHSLSIPTLRRLYEETQTISASGLGVYYRPLVQKLRELGETTPSREQPQPLQRYVLVIDEINRANMSRVFGELITLLEDDKRLGEENALTVTLPNGEPFSVPPNLYLVGTMNTTDKSLALLDIALRRRFEFRGIYPQPGLLPDPAKAILEQLNKAIFTQKRSADFLIGHGYFMGNSPLESVLNKRIFPLLMEYCGGNQVRVEELLGEAGLPFHYDPVTYQLCYGPATDH